MSACTVPSWGWYKLTTGGYAVLVDGGGGKLPTD